MSGSPLILAMGGMVALAAAMGVGRFIYTPILPVMVDDLDLTQAQAGLIGSANFVGYLLGALAAALPALPGSRRTWMLGMLTASALTTAGMALPTSMATFLALRFAGGFASAFVLVFASALVLDRLAAAGRGGLAAVHFGGVGIGIAVSALVVATQLAIGQGWRPLWLAGGTLSLLAVVIAARWVPRDQAPPTQGTAAAPAATSGTRGLGLLIAGYGLFGFGYVITATFIVAIVRGSPDIAPVEPMVWIVVGLAAAPSVALWTWVAGRLGVFRTYAVACVVEAVGVALSVASTAPTMVLIAAALLGGTFMGITALGLAGGRILAQGDPRRTLALMTAAFGLGQAVGPVFAGALGDLTGSFTLPSMAAAAALVTAAVLVARIRQTDG